MKKEKEIKNLSASVKARLMNKSKDTNRLFAEVLQYYAMERFLYRSRIWIQVDVGFGDAVYPKPQIIDYPVILDFPKPRIKGYPIETVVAEKFEAMVKLGVLNSRMKDFYDVWLWKAPGPWL